MWGNILGSIIGAIKGDTRSLDCGSYRGFVGIMGIIGKTLNPEPQGHIGIIGPLLQEMERQD